MNFCHFVITQFNLRGFPKSSVTDFDKWTMWTHDRILIFKSFTLPSILNQTEKDFYWLIYFDASTPEVFHDFIKDLNKFEFIKVCFCNGVEDFLKNHFNEVRTRIKKDCKWIITTRLDNDDVLHQNAIEVIQKNFIEKDKFLISLASGYVLDLQRNVLAHYFYPMSPFLSLIESATNECEGVFAKIHTQWPNLKLQILKEIYLEFFNKSKRQSRFILKHPMWIQLYHGKNVSNSFYRGFPVINSTTLSDFSINIYTNKMSIWELPKFWNYVMWKRYYKSLIVKVLLNK